jgi:hypothetical protein
MSYFAINSTEGGIYPFVIGGNSALPYLQPISTKAPKAKKQKKKSKHAR